MRARCIRGALVLLALIVGCASEPLEAGGCGELLARELVLVEIIEGDLRRASILDHQLPDLEQLRLKVAEQARTDGADADAVAFVLEQAQRASELVGASPDPAALLPPGWLVGGRDVEDQSSQYLHEVLAQALLIPSDSAAIPQFVYCSPEKSEVVVAITETAGAQTFFGYLR